MGKSLLTRSGAAFYLLLGAVLFSPFAVSAADRPAQISVGFFQQWPAPVQFAQQKKTFDALLGLQVNWVPFSSGTAMSAALASGEVQIGYSLGHVPFLVAVNSGIDLTVVGIAVSYPGDDNCILRNDAGIDHTNAAELAGKQVALRPGSVSHFRMLKVLEHLGVAPSSLKIRPVADGNAALQALRQGDAVMACSYGSSLKRMAALGKPLLSGAEQDAIGLRVFDVIAVSTGFMRQHADIVRTFMAVTDAANQRWKTNPEVMRRDIARAAYMDRNSVEAAMRDFQFPSAAEQKSDAWLGRQVADYSGEIAEFFVSRGQLQKSLDSYESVITTRFLP